MAEIHVLSKETIDQIAAGEVVERPSSVVKELVENSMDAGADSITVEIKEGGIRFIRVTDNGCGIEKNQVPKAFLRHATSKITSAEDLSRIESLGFRGEALSSIAAVSQLELITKAKEELTGIRCRMEAGKSIDMEEIGAPDGTTMLVRNLFYNTPARRKFLRQPQTEGGYIAELMEHMALSHPRISFQFINNGQIRFHTSGNGDLKELIYRIYGRETANALLFIDVEENGIHMSGFIGKPEINRSNRSYEIYFVNGRLIHSSLLQKAVEEGCKKYRMQHRFPFAVLHFTVCSREIDVNVHPSKMEVRFTGQRALYDFIATQIAGLLHRTELIPDLTLTREKEKAAPSLPSGSFPEPFETGRQRKEAGLCASGQQAATTGAGPEKPLGYEAHLQEPESDKGTGGDGNYVQEPPYPYGASSTSVSGKACDGKACQDYEEVFFVEDGPLSVRGEKEASDPAKQGESGGNGSKVQELLQKQPLPRIFGTENRPYSPENAKNHANIIKASEHIFVGKPTQMNLFEERLLTEEARSEYRILGQIFDTYWLIAFQDRLFIMDQHAAHEKVKYEKFMRELKEKQIVSQLVDPPLIITLTGKEESVLSEYLEVFRKMGFELEAFGGMEYAIRSVPADLYGLSGEGLFTDILDGLSEGPKKGAPEAIEHRIATMACKAAVKGNMSFGMEEIKALLDQLLCLEDPYHCPHGRPTIISMSRQELEKKFKRIV